MVAINFPDSPTNGQEHSGYVWDATNNVWNRLPTLPALDLVNFSAVAPTNPQDGQFWFDTTAGKMYVYYNDGSSAQWVSTLGGLVGQTGTEGQQLIHNGTEWVAYDGKSRNIVINGAMQVHQRGVGPVLVTGQGYNTADRWRSTINFGEWDQTVEDDAPANSGFSKSLKTASTLNIPTLSSTDFALMDYVIEGQDLQFIKKGSSEAKPLTASFWVKSNLTGTFVLHFEDAGNDRSIGKTYQINSSNVWEKKTITFEGDTVGEIANDNSGAARLRFWMAAGSNYSSGTLSTSWADDVFANWAAGQTNVAESSGSYLQITGVQLETGTIATPFEHKSYGEELAECQRYYVLAVDGGDGSSSVAAGVGAYYSSSDFRMMIPLPATLRDDSTLVVGTVTDGYRIRRNNNLDNVNDFVQAIAGRNHALLLNSTEASGTAGHGGVVNTRADGTFIAFDAEL